MNNINTSIAAVATTEPSTKPPSSDLSTALWNIVSRSDTKLNSSQQQALYNLPLQFQDIVAADQHDLSHTNAIKHQISTGNSPPIKQRAR